MANQVILKALPFDSREVINPQTSEKEYDRVAYSADLANWMKTYFGNGIIVPKAAMISDEMQATASGLTVTVNTGAICINGRTAWIEDPIQLTVNANSSGSNRIDRIVAELNLPNDRQIAIKVIEGTTSAPALVRNSDVYQMSLARVQVNAGTTTIASLTDERSNEQLCGVSNVLVGVKAPEFNYDLSNFAYVEYGNSATKAYVVGEYLVFNEHMYRVISPIAVGGTLTPNSNIVITDAGAELNRTQAMIKTKYIERITSSRTWYAPAGVDHIELYLVSGGGGGGLTGGGKGGKILYLSAFPVTPGAGYAATIGAGGTGGQNSNASIWNGGDTVFGSISTANYFQAQDDWLTNPNGANPNPKGNSRTGLITPNVMGFPQICPIDGKAYGIGGASAGAYKKDVAGSAGGDVVIPMLGINRTGGQPSGNLPGGGASANANGSGTTGGSGAANTGNGGGGASTYPYYTAQYGSAGNGGSGIIVIGYYK